MSSNKSANEEGFQEEFFKHGLCALVSHLADFFIHVVRTGFPSAWSHGDADPSSLLGAARPPGQGSLIIPELDQLLGTSLVSNSKHKPYYQPQGF
jgi:hypothetical protein